MRMAFGLVGLLVTVAVIVMVMRYALLPHTEAVLKAGKQAHEEVSQIAGVDDNGRPAMESAKFFPETANNRLVDLQVESIVPGGALEQYFGLKVNDTIVGCVFNGYQQKFSDDNLSTPAAQDLVLETYQKRGQLMIKRDGATGVLMIPAASAAGGQPAGKSTDPLNGLIQNIPTH